MTTPAEQIQLDSTHHNLGYFCKTLTNSEDMRLVDLSRIELYYFTLEGEIVLRLLKDIKDMVIQLEST